MDKREIDRRMRYLQNELKRVATDRVTPSERMLQVLRELREERREADAQAHGLRLQ